MCGVACVGSVGMTPFSDLRDRLFADYHQGRFRAALEMIEGYEPVDRAEEEDLFFWRMCLQSRLGDTDEALSLFSEALDRGYWWSETILMDNDLDPLRDLPKWVSLIERSAQLQSIEVAPELTPTVISPTGPRAGDRRTLLVLHSAGSRPEQEAEHWRSVSEDGWTIVAPQSSQRLSATGRYGWHDLQQATNDVMTQLNETGLLSNGGLVFGGFSQGGGLAIHLTCGGHVAVAGLVAVAPTFHWGLPEAIEAGPVDTWIFLGDEELPRISDAVTQLSDKLRSAGWPVHVERLAGVGHAYPPDFETHLATALAQIGSRGVFPQSRRPSRWEEATDGDGA